MTTINEYVYSTNYSTVKGREYLNDPFKYAIARIKHSKYMYDRYNSEDTDIRDEFRRQRKVNNQKAYTNRKLRLEEEAKMKANVT